jgi:hypothetical protein
VQLADERVDVDSRAWRETLLESHAAATETVSEQPRAYAFGRLPSTEKVLARPIAVVDSVVDTEVLGQQDVPRIRPRERAHHVDHAGRAAGFSSQVCGFRISTSAKSGQYKELPLVASRNTVPICSIIP